MRQLLFKILVRLWENKSMPNVSVKDFNFIYEDKDKLCLVTNSLYLPIFVV